MTDTQRIKITVHKRIESIERWSGSLDYDEFFKAADGMGDEAESNWCVLRPGLDNAACTYLNEDEVVDTSPPHFLQFEGPGIHVAFRWAEEGQTFTVEHDEGLEKLKAIMRGEHKPFEPADPEGASLEEQADALMNQHGGSIWDVHPDYPMKDWVDEVINGDTRLGYWMWVANEINNSEEE